MPMIDVYAAVGKFSDKHRLAQDLAIAVMKWGKVPPINLFRKNTAAFVHGLPPETISNAAGDSDYVRVQVLTPVGVFGPGKTTWRRAGTDGPGRCCGKGTELVDRTWVLITESPDGGWGINGHANTGEDILAAAQSELKKRGPS